EWLVAEQNCHHRSPIILPDTPKDCKSLLGLQRRHVGSVHSDTIRTSGSSNLLHVRQAGNLLAQFFQASLRTPRKIPVCENCHGKLHEQLGWTYLTGTDAMFQYSETVDTLSISESCIKIVRR